MTNEMLQTNDTNTLTTLAIRLLVAIEMSLKKWRLVMSPEGGTRNRVKTVEAGNYLELEKAVAEARERFKLPPQTPVVFCYEAGRDGFYPYRRLTEGWASVFLLAHHSAGDCGWFRVGKRYSRLPTLPGYWASILS